MQPYRDLLDAEIGDEPPSRIDIDLMIRRSRRRHRIRRIGALGGSCLSGVLALVVAVGLGQHGWLASSPAGPADPPPTGINFAGAEPVEPLTDVERRLAAQLPLALRRVEPRIEVLDQVDPGHIFEPYLPNPADPTYVPVYWIQVGTRVRVGAEEGRVAVMVSRRTEVSERLRCSSLIPTCAEIAGPDHTTIITWVSTEQLAPLADIDGNHVHIDFGDGSTIDAAASQAVMTMAQLQALALDHGLALYQ